MKCLRSGVPDYVCVKNGVCMLEGWCVPLRIGVCITKEQGSL